MTIDQYQQSQTRVMCYAFKHVTGIDNLYVCNIHVYNIRCQSYRAPFR